MIEATGTKPNGQRKEWTQPTFLDALKRQTKRHAFFPSQANPDAPMGSDPAFRTPGVAPNYAQYMLMHPTTFQGMFGTFSHVYRTSDEALNASWDNARYMRNDPGIMECVEARQRSVALLPWHIEAEDEHSQEQQALATELTKILNRLRRFTEYRFNLLHAVWFGRAAIQHRYGWVTIGGKRRVMPAPLRDNPGWMPVHGDKLCWRYDDGSGQFIVDQVGIRVGQRRGFHSRINDRWTVEPTDRGMAYFLSDWERPLLAIHKHMIEDGAFEQPQDAGFIHGIGIRHRIYWEWFQKQEALAFLMEFLERSAGGVEVHYYPDGNETARQSVKQAIQDRVSNGHNVMMYPKPAGEDPSQYGVDFIEPGTAGIDSLKQLLIEYYGHRIKRYILGQTLSSEASGTGLGSGLSELQYDTLQQIIRYDAVNLEETITNELLRPLQIWNFPQSKGIWLRFKIEVETDDVDQRLDAYSKAFEMGLRLKAQDIYALLGAEQPKSTDEVLEKGPEPAPGGGLPGMPASGATEGQEQEPKYDGDDLAEETKDNLFGDPDNSEEGKETYVAEGGEWKKRRVPDFDTGDRVKTHDGVVYRRAGEQKRYRDSGERWITIGGGEGGKGTHVKVKGGKIVGGPKALEGKQLDSLGDKPNKEFALKREPARRDKPPKATQKQLFDPDRAEPRTGKIPGAASDLQGLHKTDDGRWTGATQMDVSQLKADPKRFQYKISGIDSTTGTTNELKEVKQYDPEFGGQLLVWHDPQDGQTYVINGHHRHELASRSAQTEEWKGKLPVYFVNAKTATEARARGALANMAEGRGTAVDAAKFLRDSEKSVDDLKASGISLKGRVAQDGAQLAKLADPIFQKVANGQVSESRALAIAAELGDDRDLQSDLFKELTAIEAKTGKEISDSVVREMAREYKDVPTTSTTTKSLFGDSEDRHSLMFERNTIKSEVRKLLGEERSAFRAVAGGSGEKRKGTLERGGINKIDIERSREELKRSEIDFDTFDKLVNYKGPIADAVNSAAKELSDAPRKRKQIVERLAGQIRDLSQADRRAMESGDRGHESASGPGGLGGIDEPPQRRVADGPTMFHRHIDRMVERYGLSKIEAVEIVRDLEALAQSLASPKEAA